jgi:hypothetical protein
MNTNAISDQPSPKKSSYTKIFPPLGVKLKDNTKDFFLIEKNISIDTECGLYKYSGHEDGKQTAQTTTRSTKYNSSNLKSFIDNTLIWELTERIDSYNLKLNSKQNTSKKVDFYATQIDLSYQLNQEVYKILKLYYPELGTVISNFGNSILKSFQEFLDYHIHITRVETKNLEESKCQIINLTKELGLVNQKYSEIFNLKKIEDMNIAIEIDQMFPSHDLGSFKEKIAKLQKIKPEGVTQLLKELYYDMNKERTIPEETIIDFEQLDAENVFKGLKGNYELIVTSSIKRAKEALRVDVETLDKSVETFEPFVDPAIYEELNKAFEKSSLICQSAASQIEKLKEDLKTATKNTQKTENEKVQLKIELSSLKYENDRKNKEIINAKNELETKKTENIVLLRLNSNKDKEIDELEKKVFKLRIKISEIEPKNSKILDPNKKSGLLKEELNRNSSNLNSFEDLNRRNNHSRNSRPKNYPKDSSRKSRTSNPQSREIVEDKAGLNKYDNKTSAPKNIKIDKNSDIENKANDFYNAEENNYKLNLNQDFLNGPINTESSADPSENLKTIETVSYPKKNTTYLDNKYLNIKNTKAPKSKSIDFDTKPPKKKKTKKAENPEKAENPKSTENSEVSQKLKLGQVNKNKKYSKDSQNLKSENEKKPTKSTLKKSQKLNNSMEYSMQISFDGVERPSNDKCCGNDERNDISIGIQAGLEYVEAEVARTIHYFNPNNIYGLRGDIYYQKSVFQPQPRMPESQNIFSQVAALDKNN